MYLMGVELLHELVLHVERSDGVQALQAGRQVREHGATSCNTNTRAYWDVRDQF